MMWQERERRGKGAKGAPRRAGMTKAAAHRPPSRRHGCSRHMANESGDRRSEGHRGERADVPSTAAANCHRHPPSSSPSLRSLHLRRCPGAAGRRERRAGRAAAGAARSSWRRQAGSPALCAAGALNGGRLHPGPPRLAPQRTWLRRGGAARSRGLSTRRLSARRPRACGERSAVLASWSRLCSPCPQCAFPAPPSHEPSAVW